MNHLSLRLAWHNDGWNGHVCKEPKKNTYCIGAHSYPGDMISNSRDLDWESMKEVAGCHCSKLDEIPPCAYSINAFGLEKIKAKAEPPDFFNDTTTAKIFDLPAATACVWPYEVMYGDDVKTNQKGQVYDYNKRLQNAVNFFKGLTNDKSLVFYYANKSNPFSEEDNQVYVLVGIARLSHTSDILFYENVSEDIRRKYADGFIWQMPVTSKYPDEGFKLPYSKYQDNQEVLEHILYIPEHPDNFKYAAKHISDDDALIYVERLINIVDYLITIGDKEEDWTIRKAWLQSLLAELWQNRGAYPGLPAVLDFLSATELISFHYEQATLGKEKETKESIFQFLNDRNCKELKGCNISPVILDNYRKSWQVKIKKDARDLIEFVLCRIALQKRQIENILKENRSEQCVYATLKEIRDNPFILSEQYIGNEYGDEITFTKIDHALLPAPQLGLEHLVAKDDARRLRGLIIEELRWEDVHSFVGLDTILANVNSRIESYPDWKKAEFNEQYIDWDKEHFEKSLYFRTKDNSTYLYLIDVFNDERLIEEKIIDMVGRGDIKLRKPFKENQWKAELYNPKSPIAQKAPTEYETIIQGQIEICSGIFNKPMAVLAGSAGTGKTTLIKAIIRAINFTSGNAESVCLLAPTGKAADRIREKTGEDAYTIHSFISRQGWLNPNFTLKKEGGSENDAYTTIIIDECSMIDLSLMATLFKAINWNYLKRIIFVGDPNQLPPIGRGKVFYDIITFLQNTNAESYGKLIHNVRQLENKVDHKGTGIIDLASLYIRENIHYGEGQDYKAEVEDFIKRIHESDEDIDKDLRIVTWQNTDELDEKLTRLIQFDKGENEALDIMHFQVLSPYKGEVFGTEHLNGVLQKVFNSYNIERKGNLAGITYFDKIIQFVNRSGSNPYWSYNMNTRTNEKVEVFNGEMGRVRIHNFDRDKYKWNNFRLQQFQVVFERKVNNFIEFKSASEVENNLQLGYAISVHKAQGSEFDFIYLVIPKHKTALLSTELIYTGITRAAKKLTVLIEQDYAPLLSMRRPERSKLASINSSVFEFKPLPEQVLNMRGWYEEGKIHSTLTDFMVRSKSEVIIANLLCDAKKGIKDFLYEEPLVAPDGTFYLPDFTVHYKGRTYYWEHLGLLEQNKYKKHWEEKKKWYEKHFPKALIVSEEGPNLTKDAEKIIAEIKSGKYEN